MANVSYTKLRDGSWGLRGSGLNPGSQVQVKKKDGTTKTEVVGKVLWEGDGVCIATIDRPQSSGGGGRGEPCADCGEKLHGKGKECRDSSGLVGLCCQRCARMSPYERSFA